MKYISPLTTVVFLGLPKRGNLGVSVCEPAYPSFSQLRDHLMRECAHVLPFQATKTCDMHNGCEDCSANKMLAIFQAKPKNVALNYSMCFYSK